MSIGLLRRTYGASLSLQTVSNILKALQGEVASFHKRDLADDYQVIYLDGLWLKITSPLRIKKVLLMAYGLRADAPRRRSD